MKVLWITNILFPEVLAKLSSDGELKSSGGWMLGSAKALLEHPEITLYVASVSSKVSELTRIDADQVCYYVIPYGKGNLKENPEYRKYWLQVNAEIGPDIVHIHGTEFSHGYEYMRACGVDNVVVSIQGLKSAISRFYYSGMSKCDIYRNITPRDVLKGSILSEQRSFERSAEYEEAILKAAKHIIGRTSWDRDMVTRANPDVEYHFCNETLRDEFYCGSMWDYDKCSKHTIFLSQAAYPIKGLHQVLKAMPMILKYYPDTTIRIAGTDITRCNTLKELLHFTGYGLFIRRLIKNRGLDGKVCFLGGLNAQEMKQEYLNSNVFICPSSIENSPNSLGEAQILGVPCVASKVGGIPDMMEGNEGNLYSFENVDMLADKVCKIFEREHNQIIMRVRAMERHDPKINCSTLLNIYASIINKVNEI